MANRLISPEDLFDLKAVSDPQISPDGTHTAYVETSLERDTNEYHSKIWVVANSQRGEPQLLTPGPYLNHSPRWSPDGKWLAFISNRGGKTHLWIISSAGGEAQKISPLQNLLGPPVWSPDGHTIACITVIGKEGPEEDDRIPIVPPRIRFTEDVLVIDRLYYKLDTYGFLVNKHCHLFTISVFGPDRGTFRQLTFGNYNYSMPAWSPDGHYIAVVGNRVTERREPAIVNDIWLLPFRGGQSRLLFRGKGPINHPAWSPDGKMIAFIGHNRRYGRYTFPGIWLISPGGGEPRELTARFDFPVGNHAIRETIGYREPTMALVWSPDGGYIYACVSAYGAVHLWRFSVPGGEPVQLTNGRFVVYAVSFNRDISRVAMAVTNPTLPGDIWLSDIIQGSVGGRRLTNVNRGWYDKFTLVGPERFTFRAENGPEVEGWIIVPPRSAQTGKTPAILSIHGGPMLMYGYTFMFQFQLLASNGFAVIYTNPRGSFGYGQNFAAAIKGDWGNLDYVDLMAALNLAISKWAIDPDSIGVAGGSYGGFMTNWIVTHTNRFKAAVSMRSISNFYSFFGTSDGGFALADEFGGPPWELPQKYLKHSPINYVTNVQTPVLIIHGDRDFRCPIEQGEQFYTALKFLGRHVRMVRFLHETHGLPTFGKPWHRVMLLEHILKWFMEYLKPDAINTPI